jgi:hypothetical protein
LFRNFFSVEFKKDDNPPLADSAASVATNRTVSRDTSRQSNHKAVADQSRASLRSRADRSAADSVFTAAVGQTVCQFVTLCLLLSHSARTSLEVSA